MSRGGPSPGRPPRCAGCCLQLQHCICAALPQVHSAVAVVFVRHNREGNKTSGTARIAQRMLCGSTMWDPAGPQDLPPAGLLDGPDTWLLLDGPGAVCMEGQDWGAAPPRRLVLVDGTWGQARRLATRIPSVARLPRVYLAAPPAARTRLRQPHTEHGRGTLEALADALHLLGEEAQAAALHQGHALFVDRVLRQRGLPGLEPG